MKKFFIIFILLISEFCTFAQEFVFPPELNWWIDEIKKVEPSVIFDKFEFVEESFILEDDHPLSFKNKLYPVYKKWNFYGDRFAYNIKDAKITVREYRYPVIVKRMDWEKLKLNWIEQRSDYFESTN